MSESSYSVSGFSHYGVDLMSLSRWRPRAQLHKSMSYRVNWLTCLRSHRLVSTQSGFNSQEGQQYLKQLLFKLFIG